MDQNLLYHIYPYLGGMNPHLKLICWKIEGTHRALTHDFCDFMASSSSAATSASNCAETSSMAIN
jgi:hypothetical protein